MEEANVQEQKQEQKAEKPKGPSLIERIKGKLGNYKRVLEVARKPTKEDFFSSAKVAATGITILGLIGFAIFMTYFLVTK
jgi:protein translocase SEC61 complex gamma subunit